jgi:hypothetical protein
MNSFSRPKEFEAKREIGQVDLIFYRWSRRSSPMTATWYESFVGTLLIVTKGMRIRRLRQRITNGAHERTWEKRLLYEWVHTFRYPFR